MTTNKMKAVRAMAKAITYRIAGSIETFVVAYLLTGETWAAASMMGVQAISHVALYVAHEFAWTWATETDGGQT